MLTFFQQAAVIGIFCIFLHYRTHGADAIILHRRVSRMDKTGREVVDKEDPDDDAPELVLAVRNAAQVV